ncbi:MAG: ferredoxin [Verrucomicrobiales bacterium]|jgi:ferredoxin
MTLQTQASSMSKTLLLPQTGREDAFPENVTGEFYVNTDCIICTLCSEIAADVFRTSEDGDHNYVHTQPTTAEQLASAEEALECCPVEAIVRDEA